MSLCENSLSYFYPNTEIVPVIRNIPIELNEAGEVVKWPFKLEGDESDPNFQVKKRFLHADLSHAVDPFSREEVNLKSLVDTAFLSSGRLFYH